MNRGCLQVIIALLLAILAVLAIWWWFFLRVTPDLPESRNDDAGNYSFARQVVPLLQGRKIRGYDEVKVLADLASATDRETLVSLLTRQNAIYADEYIEHWSDLIVDWMRVHRETGKSQIGCFNEPLLATVDADLARHIRDTTPNAAGYPTNFNMSDVLRSSLKLDNLAPSYQAYLFPLVNQPITGAEVIEQNRRADLGATFTQVYTQRQMTCVGCHTTTTSASGPETFWNRHYPIFGNFEKALYGFDRGRDSREVEALLRHQGVASGSNRPWGMSSGCGQFTGAADISDDPLTHPDTGLPLEAYFVESHGQRGSVWDLESQLRSGFSTLRAQGLVRGPDSDIVGACAFCESSCDGSAPTVDPQQQARETAITTLVDNRCTECHGPWGSGDWKTAWVDDALVVAGNPGSSRVVQRVEAGEMPPGYAMDPTPLAPAEITTIRDWITNLTSGSGGSCDMCPTLACDENLVQGDAAFAYLVASNVVSNTWQEIFGPKLTIANYFPRSAGQGTALWNLTENEFIPNQWSLQTILRRMLTSEYFNRKPPQTSSGSFSYELPLFFDPWIEGDPRFPPRALPGWEFGSASAPTADPAFTRDDNAQRALTNNAMTEAVHRYRPRSLLYSVHRLLGWSAPTRFSNSSNYPSDQLRKSIGQFWRDAEPGFNEVDFQGLLNWESVHGQCQNPGAADDWIDQLVAEVASFNTANPSAELTYRDLSLIMKDWFMGYASIQSGAEDNPVGIGNSEQQLLTTLLGGWDEPAIDSAPLLESKLRNYCGVLLQTPQFMLAGIAPTELGEKPRMRHCPSDGLPCSYREICQSFQSAFTFPRSLVCHDDTLEVRLIGWPDPEDFCPRSDCGFIDRPIDIDCLLDPQSCPLTPECKLGCEEIDCCGGPLPPLDRPGFILDRLAGANVTKSQGVLIKRVDQDQFTDLQAGATLQSGDLLVFPAGSHWAAEGPTGARRTPDNGMPAKGDKSTWYVMVAGAPQHSRLQSPVLRSRLPQSFIKAALTEPWMRYGEAGPPRLQGQTEFHDLERMGPKQEYPQQQGPAQSDN